MRRERSYLEWKVNLPFMWINAAANDELTKENLVRDMIFRTDQKIRNIA